MTHFVRFGSLTPRERGYWGLNRLHLPTSDSLGAAPISDFAFYQITLVTCCSVVLAINAVN